ncbi:2Fe-2S iron-sulfur cluster-binding protein [Leptolyngbya sp. AN03gr2]|uniref:2Fe-2S iron-sulfur cluster-binding protein n=1 Tax=unclassified Leptolyngbya TaxID=2650499 RepID=UPI003D31AACB
MPTITAQGKTIECESGANLRQVLLKNGIDLYNGNATVINCRGIGTCGTCSVEIEGDVSEMDWREKARLSLPPHNSEKSRRLACQVRVLDNIRVTKYGGFWGQEDTVQWKPET